MANMMILWNKLLDLPTNKVVSTILWIGGKWPSEILDLLQKSIIISKREMEVEMFKYQVRCKCI